MKQEKNCLLCRVERIVDGARRNPSLSEVGKARGLLRQVEKWEGVKEWCSYHREKHKSAFLILMNWCERLEEEVWRRRDKLTKVA